MRKVDLDHYCFAKNRYFEFNVVYCGEGALLFLRRIHCGGKWCGVGRYSGVMVQKICRSGGAPICAATPKSANCRTYIRQQPGLWPATELVRCAIG